MGLRKSLAAVVFGLLLVIAFFWQQPKREKAFIAPLPAAVAPMPEVLLTQQSNGSPSNTQTPTNGVRHRASDLIGGRKAEFKDNFDKKYKPAVERWCRAFQGHVPFDPDSLTADKFVESIGRNASYNEYVFVVEGVTLGVRESGGFVRVDYLNAPKQTGKMTSFPNSTETPTVAAPVTKEEIRRMLSAESGKPINETDVRVVPTALSGGLNGGSFVEVGGDENNFASWDYNLVFGSDGNLAYYLRGVD
jgi:hypothetical protein